MSKKLFISAASLLATAAFAVIPAAAQASETEGHYYTGTAPGTIVKEGKRVDLASFGTLTLKNVATGVSLSCHNVVGGWAENPVGATEKGHAGPAGVGATESFNPYECESAACTAEATKGGPATYLSVGSEPTPFKSPTEPFGTASRLEWRSVLKVDTVAKRAEPTVRTQTLYAKVNVHCHVQTGAETNGEPVFGVVTNEISEGSNQPWTGEPRKSIIPLYNFVEFDNASAENGEGSGELHGPPPTEETRKGKTEGRLFTVPYGSGSGVFNVKVG